jgi:dihydroorotase/N-acyl-D-amino-acid deacylase
MRKLRAFALSALLLLAVFLPAPLRAADAPFDLILEHGHVVDGTGSPWYAADVGIRDGRIAALGNLAGAAAARRIDAAGKVVAPGFIDMLGQSELSILLEPRLPSKIYQGITTEITGEGGSIAPLSDALVAEDKLGYDHMGIVADWRTLSEYFARLEKQGMGINLATYVGATQVRRLVVGEENRAATPAELARMTGLVREAMEQGAVGVSTSLQYAPAPYASTEELIALAAESARHGGLYATHMRSESEAEPAAIDEAIRIAREARTAVEIWHLKAAGKRNWGRMPEVIAKIEAARRDGVDLTADTYAYPAWFNSFSAFIPPWAHEGGDDKMLARLKDPATRARLRKELEDPAPVAWDNEWQEVPGPEGILLSVFQNPALVPLQGKTLAEAAKLRGKDAIDTLFDLLIEDHGYTEVAVFGMSEPDVLLALKQPWVSICNDSQGPRPRAPSARSTRTRAPTAPSRASSGSTSARTASSPSRTPSASSRPSPPSACTSPTAASSNKACGPTSSSSTPPRSRTSPPSRTPTSSRREWTTSWSTASP